MLLGECFAGEDAEVLFEAIKSDWSAEDEDTIQDLVVWVKQYKQAKTQVTGATATWDSDLGMYLLTIPAAYVPASGSFDIVVKGSDIDDVKIRLGVNTGDSAFLTLTQGINDIKGGDWTSDDSLNGIRSEIQTGGTATGGYEQILESTDYTFDASAKTITLNGDYATLELPQILRIINITKGLMVIYDCNDPDTAISYTAPVISYTPDFAYKGAAFANGDELQITVNKK